MVPMIRNILGGFLFSGDDVYKHVRVLSGGERTRLAVARMLLRPSNTLLLDEPTNHLDLDSKEVLLDALISYGGTLIFVSHDRYFVERLATKIIEVGHGTATVYPGTYAEFLWHKEHPPEQGQVGQVGQPGRGGQAGKGGRADQAGKETGERAAPARHGGQTARNRPAGTADGRAGGSSPDTPTHPTRSSREAPSATHPSRDEKKRTDAEAKKRQRAEQARRSQVERLEAQIAEVEQAIREIEQTMAGPGFYEDRLASQPIIDRHQALMWKVGDLMHQWEALQNVDAPTADRT
jgi:ATP-binding cassette subfamily F protein 3